MKFSRVNRAIARITSQAVKQPAKPVCQSITSVRQSTEGIGLQVLQKYYQNPLPFMVASSAGAFLGGALGFEGACKSLEGGPVERIARVAFVTSVSTFHGASVGLGMAVFGPALPVLAAAIAVGVSQVENFSEEEIASLVRERVVS